MTRVSPNARLAQVVSSPSSAFVRMVKPIEAYQAAVASTSGTCSIGTAVGGITSLRNHRRYDHLQNAPDAVIDANRAVAELVVGRGLPRVAAAIVGVILLEPCGGRVVLGIVARHLVDHHVEGRDDVDTEATGTGLEIRVAR